MKTFITSIVLYFAALTNSFSQSGWVQQNSGISTGLGSIFFTDQNIGWAAGANGVIIKTTNGGSNWISQNSNSTLPFYEIAFADQNTGWAVGGDYDNNPTCTDRVIIVKTTDGGSNWIPQVSGHSYIFNDLSVLNSNTAFASNRGFAGGQFCFSSIGNILKTTNAGSNWNSTYIGGGFTGIDFINEMSGWAADFFSTDYPPTIYRIMKSTNGGLNWLTIKTDSLYNYTGRYKRIRFLNESIGFIIFNCLKKTTDGGINWQNCDSVNTNFINSYYFHNSDTGWCVGYTGKIIRTNNGGNNWSTQVSNTSAGLSSVFFIDKNTGWITGSGGTILKTVTGGLTSVSNISTEIPNEYFLSQNYPNPFNPKTIINFQLAMFNEVKLKVFDAKGNEVVVLVNKKLNPGTYEIEFDGSNLPSGVYFYKLEAGTFSSAKKLILLK